MKSSVRAAAITCAVVAASLFSLSNCPKLPHKVHTYTPLQIAEQVPTQAPFRTTPTSTPTPTPDPRIQFCNDLGNIIESSEITKTTIEFEYIGTYYITAYCPSECGYNGNNYPVGWTTASGTICHRSAHKDRLYNPTTCAVDPKIHSISGNDLFYIEEFDRVFVAEDTGPGVKGKHLDLFYEDYSSVCSFPTGYYTVYKVKYVDVTLSAKETES